MTIDYRFLRGGSWNFYPAVYFLTHSRSWYVPDYWNRNQGFRCVYPMSPKTPTSAKVVHGGSWCNGYTYGFRCNSDAGMDVDYADLSGFRCIYSDSTNHTEEGNSQ